jgi:putative glutamine amidotransferase
VRDARCVVVSQRVVEVAGYGELRDCLDQQWTRWLADLGFHCVPMPNRCDDVDAVLRVIRPAGIVLSGGNNLALDAYEHTPEPVADAYASRDATERAMVDFAVREQVPVLGCCRGMQFLQAYFGGRLVSLKDSTVRHAGRPHGVTLVGARFRDIAGTQTVTVNSFHNFGIRTDGLAPPLRPFAVSAGDGTVEGCYHSEHAIVGTMWHPERDNDASGFDRGLAEQLFASTGFQAAHPTDGQ